MFNVPSTETIFNQYNDANLEYDRNDAADIRRENLRQYVKSQKWESTRLIVAEAPGPWGCRFSGVPFTSEAQLLDGKLPFIGQQSSNSKIPHSARGAEEFWKVMLPLHKENWNFFVWNCVPLHPHMRGKALSPIRTPATSELKRYSGTLLQLVSIISPSSIVALGKKAEKALNMVKIKAEYVRHPSRGGQKDFENGIENAFKII